MIVSTEKGEREVLKGSWNLKKEIDFLNSYPMTKQ